MKKHNFIKKSYFAVDSTVIWLYRLRKISAIDVTVYCYLCSLRMNGFFNGVRVTQERIAFYCGITENTVSASVKRLLACGLLEGVVLDIKKCRKKYGANIYVLKPLPKSGFTLVPRFIFNYPMNSDTQNTVTPKMFAVYVFMCQAQSFEYGKSWNSYNDICDRLGFGRNQRSEVIALIRELVEVGLISKTTRKLKRVFVDNIYRVVNFAQAVITRKRRSAVNGTSFTFANRFNQWNIRNKLCKDIISRKTYGVKPPPPKIFIQFKLDTVDTRLSCNLQPRHKATDLRESSFYSNEGFPF